jgi:hypothetical protein
MKYHFSKFLLFSLLVVLFLAACFLTPTEEPPGVGAKADQGYAACNPILAALEQYRSEKGAYPESLHVLAPGYLAIVPQEVNGYEIRYEKVNESFVLAFEYTGPGMNICTYTPETKWQCSGAY